jgi:transcriptional regulator with XRE-family HTH domain
MWPCLGTDTTGEFRYMARRPSQTDEELTPFARMLQEWGWAQRPPITARSDLANEFGVRKGTLNGWFIHGYRPRAAQLYAIARRMGKPAEEIFSAAGYDVVPDEPLTDPWDFVMRAVEADDSIESRRRSRLLEDLEEARQHAEGKTSAAKSKTADATA